MESTRQQISRLTKACRVMWNDFDPIGVIGPGNQTEYNSYIPRTVELVRTGADYHKIADYIRWCIETNMGLSLGNHDEFTEFTQQLHFLALKEIEGDR